MNPLTRLRQVVQPGTGHRRATRRPRRAEETVPLVVLMRPTEAMVNDLAYCPAEERTTLHAFLRTGGRVCWTCRTRTLHDPLTSTPTTGGAE
ncbi:hypothetical protein [Streptomyces shenzhenensis]|uniref:Uncharacterized protein n=1 Tax=Streptomyces shenzhenensis TaxID=943815 RepID=A0A3M0ITV0_9ACTN|nr:hypothetical protein [Streptomyces shenzhenensis]RMB85596.1 hypothetical protein CTZ28_12450 [Streptomyces shenzhenensis]